MAGERTGVVDVVDSVDDGFDALGALHTRAGTHAWVARELHDLVAPCLTSTLMNVALLQQAAAIGDAERDTLQAIEAEVRTGLAGLRQLLAELRGEAADEPGLLAALAEDTRAFEARTGIVAALEVSPGWPAEVPSDVARHVRRIVGESLTNAGRHSNAEHVVVALAASADELTVSVTDDGTTASPAAPSAPARPLGTGYGVVGMRERAALLGGELELDLGPERGVSVIVRLPWGRRMVER